MAARLVVVHGATSGPWVFDDWPDRCRDLEVVAPDLQEGAEVASSSMADYARRATRAAAGATPVLLCGWSMGGLVALLAAPAVRPAALVVLEPSLPLPLHPGDPDLVPQPGTYTAEEAYGAVGGSRHRPESRFALTERRRGIAVSRPSCPVLVVSGRDHAERGQPVADLLGGEHVRFPDIGHAALVADPTVVSTVAAWLRSHAGPPKQVSC